jgi:hypothetical protein
LTASGYVDLHLHTTHSDGVHSPEEVVAFARQARLSAIAITDHDTLDGLPAGAAAAEAAAIEFIPGVELSASDHHADVHILGYYMDPDTPGLAAELCVLREGRLARAERILDLLARLGAPLYLHRVVTIADGAPVGRPHIGAALIEAGHVGTMDEAFDRYIGYHAPAYVPKRTLDPAGAIDLVKRAGGVPVLAHPGSLRRDDLIPGLVAHGLAGIEVWHPKHDAQRVRNYMAAAETYGLLVTGGSDFHGPGRGESTVGGQPVPGSVLAPLHALARSR